MARPKKQVAVALTPKGRLYAATHRFRRGAVVVNRNGKAFLVWGVSESTISCMPMCSTLVSRTCILTQGRVTLVSRSLDAADIYAVNTGPRRHLHASEIEGIGRLSAECLAEIESELDRQRGEEIARAAPVKPLPRDYDPSRGAFERGPSADYLARRAAAEAIAA